MKIKTIKLNDIVIDAGTQQREKINDEIVTERLTMRLPSHAPQIEVQTHSRILSLLSLPPARFLSILYRAGFFMNKKAFQLEREIKRRKTAKGKRKAILRWCAAVKRILS